METYIINILIFLLFMIGLLILPGRSLFVSFPKAVSTYSLLFFTHDAQASCKSLIETVQESLTHLRGFIIKMSNGQMLPLQIKGDYGNTADCSVTAAADFARFRHAERVAITKLWLPF